MVHWHKKTGGEELDGEARQSPRRMEAGGKSDSGPIGLEVGDSERQVEASAGAWDREGSASLLCSGVSLLRVHTPALGCWLVPGSHRSLRHPL